MVCDLLGRRRMQCQVRDEPPWEAELSVRQPLQAFDALCRVPSRANMYKKTGVDPISWTPDPLARRRYPRCRARGRRIRRYSGSRWSSWFGRDGHRASWLGSSSRLLRRYATGSRRLVATPASAVTACAPRSVRSCVDCAVRTGGCARNARFWQKPRPGSRGRPDPGGRRPPCGRPAGAHESVGSRAARGIHTAQRERCRCTRHAVKSKALTCPRNRGNLTGASGASPASLSEQLQRLSLYHFTFTVFPSSGPSANQPSKPF